MQVRLSGSAGVPAAVQPAASPGRSLHPGLLDSRAQCRLSLASVHWALLRSEGSSLYNKYLLEIEVNI